jgi:hypothetical protein
MEGVRCSWWPVLALALACGDDLPTVATGSSGGSTSDTGSHPPEVIDIGQDELLLREGEAIVLTVVVHDPDGDVIGGELFGPGEPTKYADLEAHPSERWTASVGWGDVHSHWPLQFEGEVELPFSVRMTDAEGHGITSTVCGGTCIDAQLDPAHCGGCDQPCEVKAPLTGEESNGGCIGGLCQPWWGECFVPEPGSTCASQCAAEGASCVAQGCGGSTLMSHELEGLCERAEPGAMLVSECGEDLGPWVQTAVALRCCCE